MLIFFWIMPRSPHFHLATRRYLLNTNARVKIRPLVFYRRRLESMELMARSRSGLRKSFPTALFYLLPLCVERTLSVLWSNGQSPWNA